MEKLFPSEKIVVTEYFDIHQDWDIPQGEIIIYQTSKNEVKLDVRQIIDL